MKVGFIGTGRMGQAMVRRLLDAKHDVGVYNRTAEKAKPLAEAGAKILSSIADAARYGDAVYHAGRRRRAGGCRVPAGRLARLAAQGRHPYLRRHPRHPVIRKIKKAHADKGQMLVAAPMMGRPELVSSGTAGVFASGPADAMAKCKPLFDAIGRRTFEGGADPEAATAMKIANNFVLGCAIEAMGEGFALTRKYGVATPACSTT